MTHDFEDFWHPKFFLASELIKNLYGLDGCCTGGCCHIVTDDENIDDKSLEWVINECNKPETQKRIDCGLSKLICETLREMTFVQRAVLFELMNTDYDLSDCTKSDVEILIKCYLNTTVKDVVQKYDYDDTINE